jgi:hypothetical protein
MIIFILNFVLIFFIDSNSGTYHSTSHGQTDKQLIKKLSLHKICILLNSQLLTVN